jgi:ribosomal protein L37AE/L43A
MSKMKQTRDPTECPECYSSKLRIGPRYANGRQWECRECGEEFMADEGEDHALANID